MKNIAVLALLACAGFDINAQTLITGRVLDAQTSQGVEYATISLQDVLTGKLLDGTSADSSGNFTIKDIPGGKYRISASFLGYADYRSDTLTLNPGVPRVKLPVIQLRANTQTLSDVVISALAPVVENKIDKVVFNAANDITAQGGVALDVLSKVPQVSVDVDGNVTLQGNANIRFLINGKPSGVFGNNLTDALSAIPASQISRIEAITSPGARYDAQGTGGIINIILKESKIKGMNGSINGALGTRTENTSINLNARNGNLGLNAFFSGNATLRARSLNTQDRSSVNAADATTTRLLQEGYNNLSRGGMQAGMGFDWAASKRDIFTGSFQYRYFTNRRDGITQLSETVKDAQGKVLSGSNSTRDVTGGMNNHSLEWSLSYKHKFRHEGEELNIDYYASYGRPTMQYSQQQAYEGALMPYTGVASYNPGTNNQNNIALEYIRPFSKKLLLEAGAKSSFNHISSLTGISSLSLPGGNYIDDPVQSYNLHYKMNIYAGYLSATLSLFNYVDLKAGLRIEHTDISMDYRDTRVPSYNTYVPSLILSHKLDESRFVKLAYTHRIERPEYEELNPFLNLSDPYNITTGNPFLKPELGDNFELGYSQSFSNGGNLYVSLVERINSQDIKPFTEFYPQYIIGDSTYHNISITNKRNIGTEYNTGLMFSGSFPLMPHLSARANLMVFNRHIINNLAGANPLTNSFSCNANLNVNYQFPHDIVAEVFGNYKSPFNNIQGKNPQFFTYTLAIRKQLWHKKASLGFTATNPFANSVRQVTTISNDVYQAYNIRLIPLRSLGITFSYRFGKLDFGKNNKQEHGIPDVPGDS
ncbi:TonB-dependent receptor domain-containing protein [Taibaiella chishuiensis]|uniref:Outer membrane receptor protein involved in Fe transport n=1 Tax=Taibaiella chishuiensis TaxID=1434707 RepID=A0A2P8CZM5_9BACT|nr:TonB-dependent receptor [Taibaiella chishuiensis]PSK90414.1 outer membrane receptor protein involved in Fe transport [Taibaiella chishuiensis]